MSNDFTSSCDSIRVSISQNFDNHVNNKDASKAYDSLQQFSR
jgi:hypothetical protein